MKTLKLTAAESAAYAAGERCFWRAMKPQPVTLGPWTTMPNDCPYGTHGDRIELTAPRHSLPPVIDTIARITVTNRAGKWGWLVEVGA